MCEILQFPPGQAARVIVKLLLGFASDSDPELVKLNKKISTNSEAAMLSNYLGFGEYFKAIGCLKLGWM